MEIRKRPMMPKRHPKVPKKPVFPSFKMKAKQRPLISYLMVGGPWAGLRVRLRLCYEESTMVFSVGGETGHYTIGNGQVAYWEKVHV